MTELGVIVSWVLGPRFSSYFQHALYYTWDVKNGFAYLLQFFSLILDGLGGVKTNLDVSVTR